MSDGRLLVRAAWLVVLLAGAALGEARQSTTDARAAVELDHVYVYAPARSSEAAVVEALTRAGILVTAQRNVFPDGVVGRYVRFANAYLEVLWYDGTTATDPDTRRRAGWETTSASPFGVGLRRVTGGPKELPFPSRGYTPPWYEPGMEMRFLSAEADVKGPSLFVIPDERTHPSSESLERELAAAPSDELRRRLNSRVHPLGVHHVTGVRIVVLGSAVSDAARMLTEAGIVQIAGGSEPLLVITFDNAARRASKDLRPTLPLVLNY